MSKQNEDYEEQLDAEIERRICEMEKNDYEFPKRFAKKDYIILALVAAICLAMLIIGRNL